MIGWGSPTKPGDHKGCLGSPTRELRRRATERMSRMYSYANRYVRSRMHKSPAVAAKLKDERKYQQEIERVVRRRLRTEKTKAAEKRTSGAQKV